MKMAKASQADIDMALDLISVLDDIERGYFPHRFDPESESIEWLDTQDGQQYDKLLGIGQHDRLTDEQLAQAKAFGGAA